MANDLVLLDNKDLVAPEYRRMVERIEEKMPAMMRDSDNFYKSHSQYMYALLDVTAITPIRRVKHILAEVARTKGALEEGTIGLKRAEIDLRELEEKLEADEFDSPYDRERCELDIIQAQIGLKNARNGINGAIRKLSYFTTQYQAILDMLGKDHITEEDYEREEDRYHIMTCMKQALISARPRGGVIDEGNNIYLFDLGLPAAEAQQEVFRYLKWENSQLEKGITPTHEDTMRWLQLCADKFAGHAQRNADMRGWQLYDDKSVFYGEGT
jgi:hypothetical protein